jgi:outer membrane protein
MVSMIIGTFLLASTSVHGDVIRLTLDEAQSRASEHNQMLTVARQNVRAAKGQHLQSWGGYLPSVRITEMVARTNDAVNVFGFRLKQEGFQETDFAVQRLNDPDPITNFQTTLEVRQPIFNGGASYAGRKQAKAGVRAATADLSHAVNEIKFQTASAYWGLVLASRAHDVVKTGLETARAHASAAQARYDQETISRADLLAAKVRVAELEEQLIRAQNGVDHVSESLSLIIGASSDLLVDPADSLVAQESAAPLRAYLKRAMDSRPDLVASAFRASAARQGIISARSRMIPHLNGQLSVTLDSDDAFSRQGESWFAGAILSWDLFSGGRTVGAVRSAKAKAEGAAAGHAFLEESIEREVKQSYREVISARQRIQVADTGLNQAGERLRITELQYREGLATTTDLLDAESALTEAKLRRIKALHDLNVGLAKLAFVTGMDLDV